MSSRRTSLCAALLVGACAALGTASAAEARQYRKMVSVSDPLGSATLGACRGKAPGAKRRNFLYFKGTSAVQQTGQPLSINGKVKVRKSRRLKTSDGWTFLLGTGQPPVFRQGPTGPYLSSASVAFTLWINHPPALALVPTRRVVRFSKLRRC